MSMPIQALMNSDGSKLFYDPGFCRLLETYIHTILNRPDNELLEVEGADAYRYEGDFFGLLTYHGISPELHWFILRLNGLNTPLDYIAEHRLIVIPNYDYLNRIKQLYQSTRKKIKPT